MRERDRQSPQARLAEHSVAFTALGVTVAFALVALPSPNRNYGEIAGAAAVGAALIALAFCWRRIPRTTQLVVPLGFLFLAALLRLSDGGAASGFAGLYILPILWLALSGGRKELVIGLVGLVLVEVVPLIAIGAPEYPLSSWRPIVLRVSVAIIVGFTILKLLDETRARAREATRWSQRLESLNEVGNALATETELQPLLDLVAARLRELLGARVVAVLLPAGTAQLRFAAVSGAGMTEFLDERVPRAGSVSGAVLDGGRSERVDVEDGGKPVDRDLDGRLAALTSLWVPLVVRDRTIGVIAAHDKVVGAGLHFSDDDLRLAETFASRAAVAVDLSERVARNAVQRVVAAQEAERRRLARELHDETGQTLTSVTLGLKSVEEKLDDPDLREAVAALGRQVAATMQDVRRIALELRPKVLDDYGLVSALERLATTFSTQTGITVDLEAHLGAGRLPSEIETALYRIVQEGLTNIAKHADPSRASVFVTPKNGNVLVVLEDDGRGFDPTESRDGGIGLEGMRERVELLEGRLTVESSVGAGTTLVVEVPVPVSIRVLIVDDHAIVRTGLRLLLEKQDDMEAVGEAGGVDEAVAETRALKPDLVLLDLAMPGKPGLQALPELLGTDPELKVLILSMEDDPRYVREAFAAGARGYLLKEAVANEVVGAIREVAAGGRYVHPELGARLIDTEPSADARRTDPLSDREREVLKLLALGHTNHEIAKQLFISVRTAEAHRAHIMKKLGLASRAELVRYAIANGLHPV